MTPQMRDGLIPGLVFMDGWVHATGSYRIAADDMGTRVLFDITPAEMLEIFKTADKAEYERILRDRRDVFLAACQKAYGAREFSRDANITLQLKAAHFQV